VKKPDAERIEPWPAQVGQVLGLLPALEPWPEQLAGHRRRHPDLGRLAGVGLGEADFHVVAKVGAPGHAGTAAPAGAASAAAHELAEQVLEDVRHGRGELWAEAAPGAAAVAVEGGVAEAVVGGALLRILQRLVGLADFLEGVLGRLVAGVGIGVKALGQRAIGGLDLFVIGGPGDPENLVIIALGHGRP
jgi:hypothetical protein